MRPTRHTTRLAVLATGAALVLTLAACGQEGEQAADEPGSADTGTPTTAPSTSGSPTQDGSDTTEDPAGDTEAAPVYFVGDAPRGPRLYREFHQVDAADPAVAAAGLLADGASDDPDYRTLLSGLEVSAVGAGDGTIEVTASAPGLEQRPSGMSAAEARVAVQSLVYTLQGTLGTRDPVRFVGDGAPTRLLGVDVRRPLRAADQLSVLNLVSVTTPAEGEQVSGTFTAEGLSSSFEATTPWEVRDASGQVVLDGSATAEGWMDRLYPWETEVDVSSLPAGDYTFAAMTDDPSGGEEGAGPSEDTRTITVG